VVVGVVALVVMALVVAEVALEVIETLITMKLLVVAEHLKLL
jgi:hypothetical protein